MSEHGRPGEGKTIGIELPTPGSRLSAPHPQSPGGPTMLDRSDSDIMLVDAWQRDRSTHMLSSEASHPSAQFVSSGQRDCTSIFLTPEIK